MNKSKPEAELPEGELEDIPETECLELLGRNSLGRIAFVVDAEQEIFPVNYGLRVGAVVFRTAPGTKLSFAPGAHVAFEIDEYDSQIGVGWSVIVHGIAYDVTDAADDFSSAVREGNRYSVGTRREGPPVGHQAERYLRTSISSGRV